MKILVTGFAPFNKETTNPSYEAVKLLPDQIGGAQICREEIPVSFAGAPSALKSAMDSYHPDCVICVGQAGGRNCMTVERIAINLEDASIPDNDGMQPDEKPIVPDGPDAYFSSLPVRAMVQAMQKGGVPAAVSNSAGTYVCNTLMYSLLHLIHTDNLPVRGGFIHVPFSSGQAAAKTSVPPSMEIESIARGLTLAIQVLAEIN